MGSDHISWAGGKRALVLDRCEILLLATMSMVESRE